MPDSKPLAFPLDAPAFAQAARATLKLFAEANHSFRVPARTGRKDAEVLADLLDATAAWMDRILSGGKR